MADNRPVKPAAIPSTNPANIATTFLPLGTNTSSFIHMRVLLRVVQLSALLLVDALIVAVRREMVVAVLNL